MGAAELTPRSGMSELPAGQGVPRAGAANDNGYVRQAEVGGRRREPAPAQPVEARDRPMAAAGEGPMASPEEGPVPEAREGPMAVSREGLGAAAREARMAEVARLLAEPAEEESDRRRPGSCRPTGHHQGTIEWPSALLSP